MIIKQIADYLDADTDEPQTPYCPEGTHSLIIVWNWFWYVIFIALWFLHGSLKFVVKFLVYGLLPFSAVLYILYLLFK